MVSIKKGLDDEASDCLIKDYVSYIKGYGGTGDRVLLVIPPEISVIYFSNLLASSSH